MPAPTSRNYSTRRRVLVTGGAGFIGSHLCERLLDPVQTTKTSSMVKRHGFPAPSRNE